MGRDNIEKYSSGYALLKTVANFWHNWFFYRRVIVVGRENIDPDAHLIYAPNHQNALMDALAVLFTSKGQPVFLARADIFKKKFIASILYFLKILPIYRMRDGIENVKNLNDWVFDKTVEVLRNKNGLVILPEGNLEAIRRLRQLKNGICRIAFQADEATDFTLNIKIMPVGIDFTHYSRVRQVLTVVYGKPIEISDYYEEYRKYPRGAMNELRTKLSEEMKKIMVHIESDVDYEAIDELRTIINGKFDDDIKEPRLFRDRKLIKRINTVRVSSPDEYNRICKLSLSIKKKAAKLDTDYHLLRKKNNSFSVISAGILTLLLTFPVFIYGMAFNYIFYLVPNLFLKKVLNENFHSSVAYTISLILAILFLPLYFILSFIIIRPWWLAAITFLSIPLAGLFAWNYYLFFRRVFGGLRIRKYMRKKNEQYLTLKADYEELVSMINNLQNQNDE